MEGKVEKEREVYMGKTLRKEMSRWLKMRGFYPYEDRVFVTRDGRPLKKRGVEQIVERLAKKVGIQGVRCSPHALRHVLATNLITKEGEKNGIIFQKLFLPPIDELKKW